VNFISEFEVLFLYKEIIKRTGGLYGIRDKGALDSALAQPKMTFGDQELYPAIEEKAAALAYSLVLNHPFHDGNKRIGLMTMEFFLGRNGLEISTPDDEKVDIFLRLAAGELKRDELVDWVRKNIRPLY
jgi:death-on-curing protein